MATNKVVLVDTDIFLKVFRGDAFCKKHLDNLKGRIAVSVISVLELYQGATSKRRKYELEKQLRAYDVLHLDHEISEMAIKLAKKYIPEKQMLPPDCLIAATAVHHQIALYSDNKGDFNFIKELKLYNPKQH